MTIGGATMDVFLDHGGADSMSIAQKGQQSSYLLFEAGAKIEIKNLSQKTGGGATNVAYSLKKLGFDVACVACIGSDEVGSQIIYELDQLGIDCSFIKKISNAQSGSSYVITTASGERTILTHRASNTLLSKEHIPFHAMQNYEALYITSLSQDAAQTLPEICAYAKAHKILVAVNPGASQLTKGVLTLKQSLSSIDYLIMNSSEAQAFSAALVRSDESYRKMFESKNSTCLLNQNSTNPYLIDSALTCEGFSLSLPLFLKTVLSYGVRIVVVTNGANGAYVADSKNIYYQPSVQIKVMNSLGAGDAFGSCFIGSLLAGKNIDIAIKYGVLNSSHVLQHIGAKDGLRDFAGLEKDVHIVPSQICIPLP